MKVYAFVKIRGSNYGSVISMHRTDSVRSAEELEFFLPVPFDITIPCGSQYDREMRGKCGTCENNGIALCDVQKYCRALWGEGSLFDPPTLDYKARYMIDVESSIPEAILQKAVIKNKTAQDRADIMAWAESNCLNTNILIDKVTL